jgi:DNA-binding transcriptional LysR family regulator
VNVLPGDDVPAGLVAGELLRGRPVACLRTDHPLAALDELTVEHLRGEPFVGMRPGYVMQRYAHRLFDGRPPTTTYSTDGAEMGKAMVADGLGVAVLPDYSVRADPLVTAGVITTRPIAGDTTPVSLLMLHRRVEHAPAPLRDLMVALVRHAGPHRRVTGAPEPTVGRTGHHQPHLGSGVLATQMSSLVDMV